jgi:hypothetical protein
MISKAISKHAVTLMYSPEKFSKKNPLSLRSRRQAALR